MLGSKYDLQHFNRGNGNESYDTQNTFLDEISTYNNIDKIKQALNYSNYLIINFRKMLMDINQHKKKYEMLRTITQKFKDEERLNVLKKSL